MTARLANKLLLYAILALLAAVVFLPLFWILRTSLMNIMETMEFPPRWLPTELRIENYTDAMERIKIGRNYINTFTIVIPVLIGVALTSSLAAFAFARIEFPLRGFWFSLVIMTILLPGIVMLVPIYVGWSKIGLTNSFWPLIIPAFCGGGAFNVFLLRQFLLTIPRDLDESAIIDGASYFTVYRSIILPLAKPAMVVVLLFTFVGVWNDFLGQLIYLNHDSLYTVSLGLSTLRGSLNTPYNLLMAATVMVILPAVAVFLIGQRYFVEGIATTGLKG